MLNWNFLELFHGYYPQKKELKIEMASLSPLSER